MIGSTAWYSRTPPYGEYITQNTPTMLATPASTAYLLTPTIPTPPITPLSTTSLSTAPLSILAFKSAIQSSLTHHTSIYNTSISISTASIYSCHQKRNPQQSYSSYYLQLIYLQYLYLQHLHLCSALSIPAIRSAIRSRLHAIKLDQESALADASGMEMERPVPMMRLSARFRLGCVYVCATRLPYRYVC